MKKVAISLSIGTQPLWHQVLEILKVLEDAGIDGFVVLAGHRKLDLIGATGATNLWVTMPKKVDLAIADAGTWSSGYLRGMQVACDKGADYIISMDADGSHDPQDLVRFVEALDLHDVVTSSRFMPNAKNAYPLQRKVLSFVGTLVTNILLTSYKLTDFTSGFEGMSADVLKDVFKKYPPEHWVSVTHGPYHLQNTELRLALIDAGYDIHEIPIVYGKKRKGKTFNLKFLLEVVFGFFALIKNRKNMKKALKATSK